MTDNVKHSSASNEHYTPRRIVEAARETLGRIDLDPASSVKANQLIQATTIFTEEDDGLEQSWGGQVLLNPPGGGFKRRRTVDMELGYTRSSQCLWWMKLMQQYALGNTYAAVFVGFSIELLQIVQKTQVTRPTEFPLCVPSERIAFDKIDEDGERVGTKQPSHANVIVCVSDDAEVRKRFHKAFEGIGEVFNE